jgi:hypothetical protein
LPVGQTGLVLRYLLPDVLPVVLPGAPPGLPALPGVLAALPPVLPVLPGVPPLVPAEVLPDVPPALLPVLDDCAECSLDESLPSLFLSSLLKSFSSAVSLASDFEMEPSLSLSRLLKDALPVLEAPADEDDLSAEEDLSDEDDPLEAEPPLADEPVVAFSLDWLVLGAAELPLEALLSLSPPACAANGTANTAAMAAAIRVLRFIRRSPQVNVGPTGKTWNSIPRGVRSRVGHSYEECNGAINVRVRNVTE